MNGQNSFFARKDSLISESRRGTVGIKQEETGKFPFDSLSFSNPQSETTPVLYLHSAWLFKRLGEDSWTSVETFLNSWINFGGTNYDAQYCCDPLGFVHLRGVIKNGSVGSSAFLLPSGYRPTSVSLHCCLSNDVVGKVEIGMDGNVVPKVPSNNAYVSLDGINFCIY